jgi:exodeoxyribonuclease VII large subunit
MEEQIFSVSDFVAVFNQSISYAYPQVSIEGEIENFKISKNKWVYFSLRDEHASVRFFGTVFHLPGPLEDGLKIRVRGVPFLHPLYGFSINVNQIKPSGEGSIKKAAKLLEEKLKTEGLFEISRKKHILHPPTKIGLITSVGSAAYHDFIKILSERWTGIEIKVMDVQVQGDLSAPQITDALSYFNSNPDPVDVIVIIRGGGSVEDLSSFNEEQLVRSIASSRISTLVAIGHEVDVSLAELVADRRCSTPTHAAESLTQNKKDILAELKLNKVQINNYLENNINQNTSNITELKGRINEIIKNIMDREISKAADYQNLLEALNPSEILKRGYAILKSESSGSSLSKIKIGDELEIETFGSFIIADVKNLILKK